MFPKDTQPSSDRIRVGADGPELVSAPVLWHPYRAHVSAVAGDFGLLAIHPFALVCIIRRDNEVGLRAKLVDSFENVGMGLLTLDRVEIDVHTKYWSQQRKRGGQSNELHGDGKFR